METKEEKNTVRTYCDIALETLPVLSTNTKTFNDALRFIQYMDAALREVKTMEEMKMFGEAIAKCKEFATQHNLQSLLKNCKEWNHQGLVKLKQIVAGNEEKNVNKNVADNRDMIIKIQTSLKNISDYLYGQTTKDTDEINLVSSQLTGLEHFVLQNQQRLSSQQKEMFLQEINNYRLYIENFNKVVDDIMHM